LVYTTDKEDDKHEQTTQIQQFDGLLEPPQGEQQEEQDQRQEEKVELFSFFLFLMLLNYNKI
jgi:hypothetical protein